MNLVKRLGPLFVATAILIILYSGGARLSAQSVSSGTVDGMVLDPSGKFVKGAGVEISNPLTGYRQTTATDDMGSFRLSNLPFNNYHIEVNQAGFALASQDVNIRSVVPSSVKIALALAGVQSSVTVEAAGADLWKPCLSRTPMSTFPRSTICRRSLQLRD
jgi:hypothetical protein